MQKLFCDTENNSNSQKYFKILCINTLVYMFCFYFLVVSCYTFLEKKNPQNDDAGCCLLSLKKRPKPRRNLIHIN